MYGEHMEMYICCNRKARQKVEDCITELVHWEPDINKTK